MDHASSPHEDDPLPQLQLNRHIHYFSHCLKNLPGAYATLDTNRLTLVHFAVQSLDLLGALDDDGEVSLNRSAIIEWIYSLYTTGENETGNGAGFKGGTFLGAPHLASGEICGDCGIVADKDVELEDLGPLSAQYDCGHVAMTYTALCTLATLGDDLKRFEKTNIIRGLTRLQNKDGSFQCTASGSERDMRFLYCACAISHMLNDWSGIDVDGAVDYVLRCRSYDGAIGLMPGQEGHGGSTFCGIASLFLMGRLQSAFGADHSWRNALVRWCVSRQVSHNDYDGGSGGMQGRPNKAEDTCYSYWIGGTLQLLANVESGARDETLLNQKKLTLYVLRNQTPMGGFSKVIGAVPDVLHSFYSVAWLSLMSTSNESVGTGVRLKRIDCALGIRKDRAEVLKSIFGKGN